MRAVVITEPGGPDVLTLATVPNPSPGRGEVVIAVVAAGVNRADLLQRAGELPAPEGVPGVAGTRSFGTDPRRSAPTFRRGRSVTRSWR